LVVDIEGASDGDQEELEALTLELRHRILELDVERAVLLEAGTAPPGSKSSGSLALGSLIVTVGIPVIVKVLDTVKTWVEHRPVRTAKVSIGDDSIELVAISEKNQQRLIEEFIRRSTVVTDSGTSNSGSSSLQAEEPREN
jgi:hypothetical protein